VLGDPTLPEVAPVITGTLGDAGWYRSNVTVSWTVVDPESIILSTTGYGASAPPLDGVPKATYYNVELWRGGLGSSSFVVR
jgi:hypothetical protein